MTVTNQATLQTKPLSVDIQWAAGESISVPYLWLRDNCACDECRVVQTTEKKFILTQVNADLQPQSIDLVDDHLQLLWPDNHSSRFSLSYLHKFKPRTSPQRAFWGAQYTPKKFNFDSALNEHDVAAEMISQLAVFGAVILTESPAEKSSLEQLAKRLGPMREMVFGRIHDVFVDASGYNVAATALKLPPHNDFASASWPPSIQVLHMLVNDASGGNSIIVDGFAATEAMREAKPEYFNVLCRVPVPFRMFSETEETYAVQPMLRCDAQGHLVHVRFSNQLMQVLDPNTPELELFYQAYHELCKYINDDAYKCVFRLLAGEMLIVASHRVLHAREAFEQDGDRHLRDAYFELENAINHLNVIERTRG